MENTLNIHYKLMVSLNPNELKESYPGYREFVKEHNISKEQEDKCFGKGYFERNPMYHNNIAITKMLKFLNIKAKAVTVFPTNSSVQFNIVKLK